MAKSDRVRFAAAIAALAECYRQTITPQTIAAYEMALDDLPIAGIEHAVKRAMREKTFMASAHELRELAGEIPAEDRAIIAWKAVKDALRAHGYYHSVDFDDKAVNAAIRSMGGWERLDELFEQQDEHWIRRQFSQAYIAYRKRGVTASEAAPLGGNFSRVNGPAGYEPPQVAMIETTLSPTKLLGPTAGKRKALPASVAGLLESVGKDAMDG